MYKHFYLPNNDWNEIFKSIESKIGILSHIDQHLTPEVETYSILPKKTDIFNAFKLTEFNSVKIILIGQDPYHTEGMACGLSFHTYNPSLPPSLKNIIKALEYDFNTSIDTYNNLLERWSRSGVLLLNSILTVRKSQASSHNKLGWMIFTDSIIKYLSTHKKHLVFMLWGNYAQNKASLINSKKHSILNTSHPSPFSAHKGFIKCKHFSKANEYLINQNINPISWL